jgi:hypothetical protein
MGPLEEELSNRQVERGCVDFICYLLTLDPEKRPTAKQALEHSCLKNVLLFL